MPDDYGPDHDPEAEAKAEVTAWLRQWTENLSGRSKELAEEVIQKYGMLSNEEKHDILSDDTEDLPLDE